MSKKSKEIIEIEKMISIIESMKSTDQKEFEKYRTSKIKKNSKFFSETMSLIAGHNGNLIETLKYLEDKRKMVIETEFISSQKEFSKSMKTSQYWMVFATIILALATAYMAYQLKLQVQENDELTEITRKQLTNQYEPEVYIIMESENPFEIDGEELLVSIYTDKLIKYNSSGGFYEEYSWYKPVNITIYNLKNTPLILNKIRYYVTCYKKGVHISSGFNKEKRIILNDKPITIPYGFNINIHKDIINNKVNRYDMKELDLIDCPINITLEFNSFNKSISKEIGIIN